MYPTDPSDFTSAAPFSAYWNLRFTGGGPVQQVCASQGASVLRGALARMVPRPWSRLPAYDARLLGTLHDYLLERRREDLLGEDRRDVGRIIPTAGLRGAFATLPDSALNRVTYNAQTGRVDALTVALLVWVAFYAPNRYLPTWDRTVRWWDVSIPDNARLFAWGQAPPDDVGAHRNVYLCHAPDSEPSPFGVGAAAGGASGASGAPDPGPDLPAARAGGRAPSGALLAAAAGAALLLSRGR